MLADELAGRSRPPERPGLCWVRGGELAYAALVRVQTSTGRDPDDLHRTGLELMAGLAGEYANLGTRVFGTADVASAGGIRPSLSHFTRRCRATISNWRWRRN